MLQFRTLARYVLLISIIMLSIPNHALEQSDGHNRASIRVSLSILPSMEISTVSDIKLDINDRSVDTNFSESFCVRGSAATKYQIVAYGSVNIKNQFILKNLLGETLAYTLSYREDSSAAFSVLRPSTPSPIYNSVSRQDNCDNGPEYRVNFGADDLQIATSGLFSGGLTLLVSPI